MNISQQNSRLIEQISDHDDDLEIHGPHMVELSPTQTKQ